MERSIIIPIRRYRLRDAILSLVALGNKAEDARTLVQAAYEKNPSATVQDLIRMALRK